MVYIVINELWALWLMLCDYCGSVMVAVGMGVLSITGVDMAKSYYYNIMYSTG